MSDVDKLLQGALEQGISLSPLACDALLKFIGLVEKWNRTHNLTAINSRNEMLIKHLLDSLSIAPFIETKEILDVGSGGGFPGVPLAIVEPDKHFCLLDASLKRTAFIKLVSRELALTNVTAVQARVEQFSNRKFATIVCRAFSSLGEFVELTRHLLAPGGSWFAMKGALPETEIAALPDDIVVTRIQPIAVPGLNAERHLICLQPSFC